MNFANCMNFMAIYDGSSMASIDVDRLRIDAYWNGYESNDSLAAGNDRLTTEYDRRRS